MLVIVSSYARPIINYVLDSLVFVVYIVEFTGFCLTHGG
nr:MAG TPA: hypothetical protein [Caudoviricetes sp.]